MALKAFMMKHVSWDEEFIYNFIESTLDVDVISLDHFEGTVLVTLGESVDFKEAREKLKKNEGEIEDSPRPIEILDPGHCRDMVVVEKLDINYLSVEVLILYIQSVFADGCGVVTEYKVIPERSLTILSLNSTIVADHVLEKQDHLILPSVDHHIQIKPFYHNFHSVRMEYSAYEIKPSENAVSLIEENNGSDKLQISGQVEDTFKASGTAVSGLKNSHTSMERNLTEVAKTESLGDSKTTKQSNELPKVDNVDKSKETLGYDEMRTNIQSANSLDISKENMLMETETLDLPKMKYKLLKGSLQSMDFQMKYAKKEEILTIQSTHVSECKSQVIGLVRSVGKSTFRLSEQHLRFLKTDEMESLMKKFVQREMKDTLFDIVDGVLTVFSLENSDDSLNTLRDTFLSTKSFQLSTDIPMCRIRELNEQCQSDLVIMEYDNHTITLTGPVEDISYAGDKIKLLMEDYKSYTKTFEITGTDAIYIKRFELSNLEHVLQDKEIIKKEATPEKIYFQYRCKKYQVKELDKQLAMFKSCTKKTVVNIGDLNKEDIVLIRRHFKKDKNFIDSFETANHCCVVVEEFKDVNFLDKPILYNKEKQETEDSVAAKKNTRQRVPLFHTKQKRVKRLPSCKLQVKSLGNILKEKTDLLVCGVESSLDLNKSKVSGAFLRTDSSLQGEMKTHSFSANGVCVHQRQFQNLTCKAIGFIILKDWQTGVSDQGLKAAVMEILDTANKLGFKSLSFPPLGVGRAFKYPAHEVSQAVIAAIHSFLNANSGKSHIKLINCLATDKSLYDSMNKEVDSNFKENTTDEQDSDGDSSISDDDQGEQEIGATASPRSSKEDSKTEELQMVAVGSESPLSVVIVHNGKKDIGSKFKAEVSKQWLYVDYFHSQKVTCWSPQLMNEISIMARNNEVWVVRDPASKHLKLKIKGSHEDVRNFTTNVSKMTDQQNKTLMSPLAPKRGTKDFLRYAADSTDTIPSYWKTKKSGSHSHTIVDVDANTFNAISNLVTKCWDQGKTGQGHDAANIPANSNIKVTKIQRLENHTLFDKYCMKRRSLFKDLAERNPLFKGCRGDVRTMQHLASFMTTELYYEINEFYLFHGTQSESLKAICNQGMDSRLSNPNALFGQGVYMAESSTKSDQYADLRINRLPQGTDLTMFLTRAAMGDMFSCDDKHESVQAKTGQKLRRPPCMTCFKDVCKCGGSLFHSVIGDGKWIFREFVVYDNYQCYPEYIITYHRC